MEHRTDIDGLRAIAVLLVIVFHFFPSAAPGGFIGVDVFFVISGYLITGILVKSLEEGALSIRGFYGRRIIRLLPALLTMLVTIIAMGWFVLLAKEFIDLGEQVIAAGVFSSNIFLIFQTNYFNLDAQTKPLLHLWSLGAEEQFYIFYPILLLMLFKARVKMGISLALMAFAGFALSLSIASSDEVQAFYSPVSRMWELLVGALVYVFHHRVPSLQPSLLLRASRTFLFVAGLGSIALGVYLIRPGHPYPSWQTLLPTIGTAAIILVRKPSRLHVALLSNSLSTYLGRISYPLYLWHWPFISVATILSAGEPSLLVRLVIVSITLGLSIGTYHFIECPIRASQRQRFWVTGLLAGLAGVTVLGTSIVLSDGFPERRAALSLPTEGKMPVYAQSCSALTGVQYKDDWCHPYEPEQASRILLLGDSFSAPYASTLAALARHSPLPFKQYARGQCAPLLNYGPKACQMLLSSILSKVDLSRVETVILALDWRQYIDGTEYFHMEDAHPESADSFVKALQETVDYWQLAGKRVVIFYAPPQGANPRACMPRAFSLRRQKNCLMPRGFAERNERGYREKLSAILGKREGILYFDPFKYLCDQSYCVGKNDGKLLYVDRVEHPRAERNFVWNHLSEDGAELLAIRGKEELETLLSPKSSSAP